MPDTGGLKRIKLSSLNDECYSRIKNAILVGQFSWGERLEVGKLASELGTSKFPIIKALDRLTIEHLVNIFPNKGTFVAVPSLTDIEEITEVRKMIEETAFDLACKKSYSALIAMMETVEKNKAENIDCFLRGEKPQDFLDYDYQFHQAIILYSNNSRLLNYYDVIRSQIELFRVKMFNIDNIRIALKAHTDIFAALKKQDFGNAKGLLLAHLEQVHQESVKRVENAGLIKNQTGVTKQ